MFSTIISNGFINEFINNQVEVLGEFHSPEIIWDDDEVRLANEIEFQRTNNYVEHFALIREYEEIYGPYSPDRN